MLRHIALTATLILSGICYVVAGNSISLSKWQEGIMFAALGCILANMVSTRTERK